MGPKWFSWFVIIIYTKFFLFFFKSTIFVFARKNKLNVNINLENQAKQCQYFVMIIIHNYIFVDLQVYIDVYIVYI